MSEKCELDEEQRKLILQKLFKSPSSVKETFAKLFKRAREISPKSCTDEQLRMQIREFIKNKHMLYLENLQKNKPQAAARRMLEEAKKGMPNIAQDTVKGFMDQQPDAQIEKSSKLPTDRMFKVAAPEGSYQADLTFFMRYGAENRAAGGPRDGYKIILTAVHVPDRVGYAVPVASSDQDDVAEGFEKVFRQIAKRQDGTPMKFLLTDSGGEFKGQDIQAYLRSKGVERQDFGQAYDKRRMGLIERFNRTLKDMIRQQFERQDNHRWVETLPQKITKYNNQNHRTLGTTPNKLAADEEKTEELTKKFQDHNKVLNRDVNIEIGDLVRIPKGLHRKKNEIVKKTETAQWSTKIYRVTKREGNKMFLEEANSRKERKEGYSPWQLQKVDQLPSDYDDQVVRYTKRKQALEKEVERRARKRREAE